MKGNENSDSKATYSIMKLSAAAEIQKLFKKVAALARVRPRESALALLGAALLAYFGVSRLFEAVGALQERNECISQKKSLVESYESIDDLISSAYRLDTYGRADMDDLYELKSSIDSIYERCSRLVSGWPN